uniref:Redox-regulatory FAM213A-like protein n=1 Tax=Fundulus heteroclitus TaxID=8078 RepID=A0A146QV31_FUNHE
MLALSRCSPAFRRRLPLRCSAPPLASASITAGPQVLTSQIARFHQSKARAGPDPNKITSVSGLEGELLGMGMWSLGLGAVGAAMAGIFLANTDWCLPKSANASLEHLEDADLRSTTDDSNVIKAKSLWEKNGAVVMAVRRPG